MAGKTISQRITLEGADDIKKQLEALGKAGETSFKQIQDAAQKTQITPARIDDTKQAFDHLGTAGEQLGNQFKALAESVIGFGSQGTKSALDVASGLQKTAAAAGEVGSAIGQATQQISTSSESAGAKLVSTATAFKLAAAGIVAAITALATSLTKGAVETGVALAGQADKLKLTTAQWVELRKAVAGTSESNADFEKSISKITGLADEAKGGIGKLGDTTQTVAKLVGGGSVIITKFNDTVTDVTGKSSEAASELLKLGVSMKAIATGETLTILREAALAINKIPEGAQRAAAGVKVFGDNWKETVKALLAGQTATVEQQKSLAEVGKASRDMTAEQADTAKKVKTAWDDLTAALRATKDQIGATLLGGALVKTEWLTKLVDGSRELLRTWLGLSDQKGASFLAGLGDSAAETAFKVLIAVGAQLAGIWRDVLVPAGAALLGIVEQIAANFEGVTKSQVAAFFITAAAAAVALAVAFKGIGLVLSPFTALVSLFAGFGPILIPLIALVVLFWDQISAGAAKAAALIPGSLAQIAASFKLLFAGDFAGFWAQFSTAAVEAFQKIKQAVVGSEFGKNLVSSILAIVAAFFLLRGAAALLAPVLSRIFGIELSGGSVLMLGLLGSLSGGFRALATVAQIVSSAFIVLGVTFSILTSLIGALPAAITIATVALAGLVAAVSGPWVAAALIALTGIAAFFGGPWAAALVLAAAAAAVFWDSIVGGAKIAGEAVMAFVQTWVTTPVTNAWQWIKESFGDVVGWISTKIDETKALIETWVTTPVANAWQWIKDALGFGGGGDLAAQAGLGDVGSHAGGGLLGGRGSGTSDSNLAWVSRGEYITPASAVAQPGVLAFLEALRRSGGNLRDVLDGMGRFALGGLVHAPIGIPAFAGGGMNAVTINFPGLAPITGLRASSDVVDQLHRAAALAQVRSGGRKPSRYS